MLVLKGWYCKDTHGSLYSSGWPDIYATHSKYGIRWVEVKNKDRSGGIDIFTPDQLEVFPKLCANGSGVWVLVDDTELEYKKLFAPFNWYVYLWKEGQIKL
jgi:hypothetical protein